MHAKYEPYLAKHVVRRSAHRRRQRRRRRRRRRQTNQDCIGSRPTFCREPKMDQDSAFMSSLMNYLFNKFTIKVKTVAPYNHQSLQAEHRIKSLPTILTKHFTNLGQMWPKYLSLATFTYNTFNSPNLANLVHMN